jgi:protein-S-isoprenylcysteine O-methyltransferase Ste14
MRAMIQWLARKRVPLGFATAVVALVLAQPTWGAWTAGLSVAGVGELIRIWAAGHLEKGREVTRSGPYRWTRHPLYVGSAILAAGVVIASRSVIVALLAGLYMAATLTAAIRTEEAFLRRTFGDTYERYSRSEAAPMGRAFSLDRALRNREYRAVTGVAVGFGLLALKILLPI